MSDDKSLKERTSITINPELHAKLKQMAKDRKTSKSALIEAAISLLFGLEGEC